MRIHLIQGERFDALDDWSDEGVAVALGLFFWRQRYLGQPRG